MIFAVIGIATVLAFMRNEHVLTMTALHAPRKTQAHLTARAGVWAALKEITDTTETDTLEEINTLDIDFTNGLGPALDSAFDSSSTSLFPDEPFEANPFSTDSFGICTVSVKPNGFSISVTSDGYYRDKKRTMLAEIAGHLFSSGDTTMYLAKGERPTGGYFEGEYCLIKNLPQSRKELFRVRKKYLEEALSKYHQSMFETVDTGFASGMEMVQSNSDFHELPETVEGDLFIDGDMRWIEIESRRTINVIGNVQITGTDVILKGIELVVNGTINIFDKAVLENVSLFARSEIMIGGEATVNGKIISQEKVVSYGDAVLGPDAVILVTGEQSSSKKPPEDASAKRTGKAPLPYSVFVSDRSRFEGTVIAVGSPGGIKTDTESSVKGIMWAEGPVCHQGEISGVIRADMLQDCTKPIAPPPQSQAAAPADTNTLARGTEKDLDRKSNEKAQKASAPKEVKQPAQAVENRLLGKVSVHPDIPHFSLPFFLGTYKITSWSEP